MSRTVDTTLTTVKEFRDRVKERFPHVRIHVRRDALPEFGKTVLRLEVNGGRAPSEFRTIDTWAAEAGIQPFRRGYDRNESLRAA